MERIRKRPPLHPGIILKDDYLDPLSVSIKQLAEYLDVSHSTVSEIVHRKAPVTAEMALRLSKTFGTSPGLWMNLQKKYDLWHAEHDTSEWQNARPFEFLPLQL